MSRWRIAPDTTACGGRSVECQEILELMSELKLAGIRTAFDELVADGLANDQLAVIPFLTPENRRDSGQTALDRPHSGFGRVLLDDRVHQSGAERRCYDISSAAAIHHFERGDWQSAEMYFGAWAMAVRHYIGVRTHVALGKDGPFGRPVQAIGRIVPEPILGGLPPPIMSRWPKL
jgi:hypothetical protein